MPILHILQFLSGLAWFKDAKKTHLDNEIPILFKVSNSNEKIKNLAEHKNLRPCFYSKAGEQTR